MWDKLCQRSLSCTSFSTFRNIVVKCQNQVFDQEDQVIIRSERIAKEMVVNGIEMFYIDSMYKLFNATTVLLRHSNWSYIRWQIQGEGCPRLRYTTSNSEILLYNFAVQFCSTIAHLISNTKEIFRNENLLARLICLILLKCLIFTSATKNRLLKIPNVS